MRPSLAPPPRIRAHAVHNDAPKPKAKLICKRSDVTGSHAAKRKECRTREEWDRIAQAANENLRYEMDRNMSRPGGQ